MEAKQDDRVQSSEEELAAAKQDVLHKVTFMGDLEKTSMEMEPLLSGPSASSSWKEEEDDDHDEHEQRIKMVKVEMREVREENQRLKNSLDNMMKEYESLKSQFHEISQSQSQREGKKSTQTSGNNNDVDDMVSLTLGRFSTNKNSNNNNISLAQTTLLDHHNWGIQLGQTTNNSLNAAPSIDQTTPTASNSDHVAKEDEAGETTTTWPPSKVLSTTLPVPTAGEDEVSQQNPPKKARVCVRARCDTPTMNDGCQWRKYGQKIAKGNPCPRAYYRCTGAPSCPVRKQVQRSVDDMSILITTYEGTHNHPLPVSAMAMASTTSAAASMLLSGPSSSTSRPGPNPSSMTVGANLHGMNLYLSNNNMSNNSKQFYLSNSSMLSSSLNHPTITLDLTSNPPSTSSSPFHKIIPSTHNNNNNNNYPPKYPFTNLDFGSSQPPNFMSWNNNNTNNQLAPYHLSKSGNSLMGMGIMGSDLTKQQFPALHSNIYQACLQQFTKPSTTSPLLPSSLHLPDTIAAATKAITSDPSFQSALVAALSSIIGGGGGEMSSAYVEGAAAQVGNNVGFEAAAPSLTCSTSKSSPSSSPAHSRDNNNAT